jgi:solute carrier family 25 S-adenosylmethionine transporter 26
VVAGHLAAGATAGAAVEAALYPIDTIKTRLQLAAKGGGLRALVAGGGGKALYAGVWGNLAGVAPASAIFMGAYEPIKARVAASNPDKPWLGPLIAGAAAGAAASVVRVPTEVVKQRVQAGHFAKGAAAVKAILAAEGVAGLFAGYGSFLLRDLPFDAIEFVAYEQLKRAYMSSVGGRDLHAPEVSAVGAAAGAVTGVLTTPLDVLKTRLMTQGASGKYKGVVDCARRVAAEEGVGTLFAGWQPRVIWIGLGGCVFFSALEAAKKAYAADPADWGQKKA